MKKLLTIILAVALILPAAALAEDKDPIVGCWYLCADMSIYPEMSYAYGNKDLLFDMYNFMQDGTVMVVAFEQTGKEGNAKFQLSGRWEKADDHYIFKIIGSGESTIYVKGDLMYFNLLVVGGTDAYSVMHRVIPLNPYTDIVKNVD
jgi:hypothetical protein